ncbi:amidohydrolase [Modestobacter sp. SSW1-42]|uniref:amidohydrolase n=1 Tax=Modestobacter sp. SSW1-42 TaxID=596372 RepID=UPI0039871568
MSPAPPWPTDVTDPVAVRRDLHAHPEVGFTEVRTAARVLDALERLGVPVRTGAAVADVAGLAGLPPAAELTAAADRAVAQGVPAELVARFAGGATALVATLAGDRPGPAVGLRVDMDALPVAETDASDHPPRSGGYASRTAGVMHACGHDGHVAIGLALAARLADRDFPGTVRLLFQPAEEGVRGAAPMVAAGGVEGLDALLAVHLGFGLDTGALALRTTDMVSTTKRRVTFTGAAAHAAHAPERGRHALLAAAATALALHTLPAAQPAGTRVNVGRLCGGTATNVVPATAELAYETRAADPAAQTELDRRADEVVAGSAVAYGVDTATAVTGRAVSADTDDRVAEAVGGAAAGLPAFTDVRARASLRASDDASLMMQAVQAAGGVAGYLLVGSTGRGAHHAPDFDLDEAALSPAVDLLEAVLRAGRLDAAR